MKIKKELLSRKQKKGRRSMQIQRKDGFGINEVIGIAATVIVAAVVIIPGLRAFATEVMSHLQVWWITMAYVIFP